MRAVVVGGGADVATGSVSGVLEAGSGVNVSVGAAFVGVAVSGVNDAMLVLINPDG